MTEKVVIFGNSHYGRAALRKCNENKKFECVCFLDSNKKNHNKKVLKKKIYHITKINKINFDKIIFCGRYVKEQLKQVKKYNIKKSKFLIWGKSKLLPPKNKIMKREKIILKMLSYVIKKFNQNKINYWMDTSGLLAVVRKQHLAEFSDVDISINSNDVEKIYKTIKDNKKVFSFDSQFISKIKKNKKIPKTPMFITGKTNPELIEPPILEFLINKITKKKIKRECKRYIGKHYYEQLPKKYFRSFKTIKYKGLGLNVPSKYEEYLKYLYGKSWKKKVEFWSLKRR
tara:strand:+ start:557 stop:1414 length:858 start_codon:yes stop_codon:yes gene_type:complete